MMNGQWSSVAMIGLLLIVLLPIASLRALSADTSNKALGNPLLVEVILNGRTLDNFHDVYESSDGELWLPIEAVTRAAEGDIQSVRTGSYVVSLGSRRPQVAIDVHSSRVRVNDEESVWQDRGLFTANGMLYLESSLLADWFGVTTTLGNDGLRVSLESEQPLPVDRRL